MDAISIRSKFVQEMSKRYDVKEIEDLTGKIAIVTGGHSGIGYETTRQLAIHGAKVYVASRNEQKANDAIKKLESEGGDRKVDVRFLQMDLMDLASCKRAAETFLAKEEQLHILVANAGIMAAPYKLTQDGIEQQFQTNHLGHFAFFRQLEGAMKKAAERSGHPSRLVNLSSFAHTFERYNPMLKIDFTSKEAVNRRMGFDQIGKYMRYSQSKLAALLFARQVNKTYDAKQIRATACHPGFVASDLYKSTPLAPFAPKLFISVSEGALASLYGATSKEIEEKNDWNAYHVTYGLRSESDTSDSRSDKLMQDLWTLSEKITSEANSATT